MNNLVRKLNYKILYNKNFTAFYKLNNKFFSKYYTKAHEWFEFTDESKKNLRLGITEFAQSELGEIVHVEFNSVGDEFSEGEQVAALESVKTAADIYSPGSVKIVENNEKLSAEPGLINRSPEEEAWIVKLEVTGNVDLDSFMSKEAYLKFLEENH